MTFSYMGLDLNTWVEIVVVLTILLSIPIFIYTYHRSEQKINLIVYYILFIALSIIMVYVVLLGNTITIV
jgi:uncharacterized protein with PQ loop repeat